MPCSGGAVINPGSGYSVGKRAACSKPVSRVLHRSPVQEMRPFASASQKPWAFEACPHQAPLSSTLASGSTNGRKKSMIEGMRVLLKRGVASNKELEQTGPAVANGMGGPCSSIQCSTDPLMKGRDDVRF